jgi:Kef-type K+ transport system membrane component KefB
MDYLPVWPLQLNTMFFIGFLLFCGALGGFVAHRLQWLPSITGFMLVGLLAGPNVMGIFSYESLEQSRIIVDIALALILYRLGLSLDLKVVFKDRALLLVSLTESTLTFAAVYTVLVWMGMDKLPSAVVAAIAISSSPAVLLHVAHELGARGPTTQRAQVLVALNNVIAFLMFAGLMPALYSHSSAPLSTIVGAPIYQLFGSGVLGLVLGWLLHAVALLTRKAPQYSLALVVGAVTMTLGLALSLGLSSLFAPLVLGMVVKSVEKKDLIANIAFGPAFELFFVALFVYAGANLHLSEIVVFAPAAGAFVLARSLAKWVGTSTTGYLMRWSSKTYLNAGLTLWPMAGMAIGLAHITVAKFPMLGAEVASIVLAGVAVFETLGPPVVARALRWAGEVSGHHQGHGHHHDHDSGLTPPPPATPLATPSVPPPPEAHHGP